MSRSPVMQRHHQIVRQWRVLLALDRHPRGLTFARLRELMSADHPVTERTIRRDVDALTLAGFPIDVTTRAASTASGQPSCLVRLERPTWRAGEGTIFNRQGH